MQPREGLHPARRRRRILEVRGGCCRNNQIVEVLHGRAETEPRGALFMILQVCRTPLRAVIDQ